MGLKALLDKGFAQCSPRTIERTLDAVCNVRSNVQSEQSANICRADFSDTPDADAWWATLAARIAECDRLIHQLCDLRGDSPEHRAELLAVRRRMAPDRIDSDIGYLRREIARVQR